MGADGWDDIVIKIIDKNMNNGCCLRMRYKNKTVFGDAMCRECPAKLNVFVDESKIIEKDNFLMVVYVITPCDTSKHSLTLKRKLKGAVLENLRQTLVGHTPLQVHTKMVNNFGTSTHPMVPNITSIRKVKSQNRREMQLASDEFASLRKLNHTFRYNGFIKKLMEIPCYVNIFWTDCQEAIVANEINYILCIDATGNICVPPTKIESKNYEVNLHQRPLFLYSAVMKSSNENLPSLPVSQMLSESHSAEICQEWLSMLSKCTKNKPAEVRVDCSSMLMLATSMSYNGCTTADYLKKAYDIIEGRTETKLGTIIRLDKSHVIKIFSRWKIWAETKCGKLVKHFYVSVLRSLISEQNFQKVKIVAIHLTTLMLSENSGAMCSLSLDELYKIIQNSEDVDPEPFDDVFEDSEENFANAFYEHDENELSDDSSWYLNIFDYVSERIQKENNYELKPKKNPYFLPEFKIDLRRIFKTIPMWSNLLKPHAKHDMDEVSTSSYVESEFNIVKNNVLHGTEPPVRSDIFLQLYFEHIKAKSIIFNDTKGN